MALPGSLTPPRGSRDDLRPKSRACGPVGLRNAPAGAVRASSPTEVCCNGGPRFPGWPRHSPSSVGADSISARGRLRRCGVPGPIWNRPLQRFAIPQPAVFPPFGPGVHARRTVFSKFCFLTPSAFARAVLFCPGLRGGWAAYRGAGRAGDSVRALSQNRTLCRARRNFARLSGRCPVTPPPRGATMAAGREYRVFRNAAGIPPYQ